MNAVPLNHDHIVEHRLADETAVYLRDNGYNVDVHPEYVVASDSGNGYLVSRLETHTKPFEYADAVEDQFELWSCTCDAYRYHEGLPDLTEERVTAWSPCKHILACRKELQAAADENQTELDQ